MDLDRRQAASGRGVEPNSHIILLQQHRAYPFETSATISSSFESAAANVPATPRDKTTDHTHVAGAPRADERVDLVDAP